MDVRVQDPACTREHVAAWLQHRSTYLTDVNGVLAWLSLRPQGNKPQKIGRILRAFDGWPNLVRLAIQCYLAGEDTPERKIGVLPLGLCGHTCIVQWSSGRMMPTQPKLLERGQRSSALGTHATTWCHWTYT